jgi:hypothetical protein
MRDSKNTHSSYYGNYGNIHLLCIVYPLIFGLRERFGLHHEWNVLAVCTECTVLFVRIWCASRPLVIRVLAYKSWKYIE